MTFPATLAMNLSPTRALTKEVGCSQSTSHDLQVVMGCNGVTMSSLKSLRFEGAPHKHVIFILNGDTEEILFLITLGHMFFRKFPFLV